MRIPRAVLTSLATLALSVGGLALGASVSYAAASEPSFSNISSSAVTQTSAILSASIDPNGAETAYQFEYGPSTEYGTSIPVPAQELGSEATVTVGQEITGLQPDTVYHYRVVATNSAGHAVSTDQTFQTEPALPPIVSTTAAVGVAQNVATLTGTLNTQGFETTYEFDIGIDTTYGTRVFGDAGVEAGTHTLTVTLQGLTAGTTYHYRIAATNVFGTSYGADETFTTGTYPTSIITAPPSPTLVPTYLLAPETGKAKATEVAAHTSRRRRTKAKQASREHRDRHAHSAHSHHRRSK